MSHSLQLALVFLCGFGAGLLYFSGLMVTILKVRCARRPGLFLMGSFILRAAFVIGVFFAVSSGEWQKFAACLVGFILARQLMVLLWRPSGSRSGKEIEAEQWKS
ncbi:MAG TPA: ATP synthase subunit I [Deltaproteobacteria bacterium]|jgi:F1F0 ATPase subunit 2|nr:ATP synthase subunit I [Deltaproteobacteria bacterium]HQI00259.1 ATP synthase subunit I [Deltaproteobacteria bacterium]HQJ07940.1 ATP synthase subunit I [Deltaproteobacteria bacterium]